MKFSIEIVEKGEGEVAVSFADRFTLGFNATDDGVVITPDWTDFHLTFGKENEDTVQNGVFWAHVKDESGDEPEMILEEEYSTWDEALADTYNPMRGLGPLKPVDDLGLDTVLVPDQEKTMEVIESLGIIESSEEAVSLNLDGSAGVLQGLDMDDLEVFVDYAFDEIGVDEAIESGVKKCFSPDLRRQILLFPDGYVIDISFEDSMEVFENFGGSPFLAMLNTTISGEKDIG